MPRTTDFPDARLEQARKLRLAADMATGITYMRQALKALDPERAREFTSSEETHK